MSSEMSQTNPVLENPQSTIGAQDLLSIGSCSKSGFLRKQGSLERFFKFLRWRQKFVVLSRGCIYIFKNEYASHPQNSYSLRIFVRSVRGTESDGRMRWTFQVVPVDSQPQTKIWFACLSDRERKDWMKSIKEEMIRAHKVTVDTRNVNTDDYVYLEQAIQIPKPAPSKEVEEEDDDPGGEKDYTTIDDSLVNERPPMPVPHSSNGVKATPGVKDTPGIRYSPAVKANPKQPDSKPSSPAKTMPAGKVARKPPPSPQPENASTLPPQLASICREAFEYDGTDREEIEQILIQRPEGTFLVRKSRQDRKEVLSVNIEGMLKEFKIYDKDSKFTIDHTDYFRSVEALLKHYTENPLPKKTAKLYRAFSVIDSRYINK